MTKDDIVHINNMQNNKTNIIQHIAEDFDWKYSDVTPFVIINISKSNCNLITHLFSLTVTDNSYIYSVIKCVISLHVISNSPKLFLCLFSINLILERQNKWIANKYSIRNITFVWSNRTSILYPNTETDNLVEQTQTQVTASLCTSVIHSHLVCF